MEASQNLATASTSRPRVTIFFPLQKLKSSQLAITSSTWVMHLDERSTDEEEGIDGDDTDGIKGITEEFIACLARAVKDAQQTEKCCYHCERPDHFIHDCPQLAGTKTDSPLNQKEGMVSRSPSRKSNYTKGAPGQDTQGVKN